VPGGLIRKTEPGSPGSQVLAELEGVLRTAFEASLEMGQRVWSIERGTTELEPILPVEGQGKARIHEVFHGFR